MSLTSLIGLNGLADTLVGKIQAIVPGLEDHAVADIKAMVDAEIANVKSAVDAEMANLHSLEDPLLSEITKIRQLVEGIVTGKVKFQAGFVPSDAVNVDAALDVKA